MVTVSRPNVPVVHSDAAEHRRILATSQNQMLFGRLNNTGAVTLDANQATTTVSDRRVAETSSIFLSPTSAEAAAEVASGNMYVSAVTAEQFTIAHSNNANTDRTFDYAVLG